MRAKRCRAALAWALAGCASERLIAEGATAYNKALEMTARALSRRLLDE